MLIADACTYRSRGLCPGSQRQVEKMEQKQGRRKEKITNVRITRKAARHRKKSLFPLLVLRR